MGAYLSEPVCEKISEAGENNRIRYGASAMQGWRMQQEDAHNCIPDFDNGASFFAVYDGHGGMEVSKFASDEFPQTLTSMDDWKNGQISQALENAFLKFDEKLLEPEIIEKMNEISGVSDAEEKEDEDDEDKTRLLEEASLPLEEVLSRYGVTLRRKKRDSGDSSASDVEETERAKQDIPAKNTKKQEKPVKRDANGVVKSPTKDDNPPDDPKIRTENDGLEPESKKVRLISTTTESTMNDITRPVVESLDSKLDTEVSSSTENEISPADSVRNGSKNEAKIEMKEEDTVGEDMKIECRKVETNEKGEVICESTEIIECHRENGKAQNQKSVSDQPNEKKDGDEDEEEDDEEYEESGEQGDDEEDDDEEDDEKRMMKKKKRREKETWNAKPGNSSGTTACVLVIKDDQVYVANAGDSRCVLCRNGKALDLSIDHKPEDDVERRRVEAAGGAITADGRVNGGLNMSRALGDHFYKSNEKLPLKDQMISPLPDIQVEKLQDDDMFLVLACDGIW
uniref:protein-serine/threonine phosphatase n=1 Tax=Romanomermis culicivorax TaxID=13658 RepID=A0A915KEY4_ROMCU